MLNFILLLIFIFGILLGGVVTFLFFIKKKIKLKSDQIENQKEYFKILNKYNKIEKELLVYKNEFNNKYVDDGYDAY
jgi:flagellar basal body-associated protein FliL